MSGPLLVFLWLGSLGLGAGLGWLLGPWVASADDIALRRALEQELSRRFYRFYPDDPIFAAEFQAFAAEQRLIVLSMTGTLTWTLRRDRLLSTLLTLLLVPPMGSFLIGQGLAGDGGPLVKLQLRRLGRWDAALLDDLGQTYRDEPD
ncbi:hypothetical protein [Roseospirillum parvum]|uniref:Uncharacterized protein n=1 Tax=Roseospirillum parvum TaxID=83401 RepID=A0A1G8BVR8_9PROT|nr:hypothetical protein [Roseospirillum parvum]SDH37198.1 hypothetical protein SAMN05421742_106133 [Roseospirillum parvum]